MAEQYLAGRRQRPVAVLIAGFVFLVAAIGLGIKFYLDKVQDLRIEAAQEQAYTIAKAVESYRVEMGEYPSSLRDLLGKDDKGKGAFLTKEADLMDPWGHEYQYDPSGQAHPQRDGTQVVDIYTYVPNEPTRPAIGNWKG